MSLWHPITKTALLGTRREPLPKIDRITSPLHHLLSHTKAATPELTLLLQAGVLAMHEENGRLPQQHHAPHPTPPQPEERPVAPPRITKYLADVMYGQHIGLLPIYLEAVNEAGYRLPNHYLPNLLDKGVKAVKIRPYLQPILGKQGGWLASQNPIWDFASPDINSWGGLTRYWENNEPVKRQQLLNALRQTNPELARQLLHHYWRSVPDLTRSQLIKSLNTNISMADEPFLEAALDDRSYQVRQKAADYLAYLPDSRFALRMANHVRFVVQWRQGMIKILFPREISPQMRRDGIPQSDPRKDISRLRTRQLTQMVSSVPLDYWTLEWKASIPEILQAIPHSRWPRTLLNAFATAARKQRNQAWIEAMVVNRSFDTQVARLLRVMEKEWLDRFILENQPLFVANGTNLKVGHPMMSVLQNYQHSWSEELTLFWLEQFANYIQGSSERKSVDMQIKMLLIRFCNKLPAALLPFVEELFETAVQQNPIWRTPTQQIIKTMRFRKAMLEDILGNTAES